MAGGTRSLAQRDLDPGPGSPPRPGDGPAAGAEAGAAVGAAARAAHTAAQALRHATDGQLDEAIRAMATRLSQCRADIIEANAADVQAAQADGLASAFVDRLLLDGSRVQAMAGQLLALAQIPAEPGARVLRALPDGLELQEWRRPVGVIGANFEARPNVAMDVASQLIKSRNAGVLRTGSSALRSAAALVDLVIGPAMQDAGLDPAAIQLIRIPGRDAAYALVRQPRLIPLVILRGSGTSTRDLAHDAALHGVRALAHADGGAVMYIDQSADLDLASRLIEASLDRLGVCNRLNLLLVQDAVWDAALPRITETVRRLGVALSMPPHRHELGHEWALDSGREATVTVARVADAASAAELANAETSGLAAAVVAQEPGTAQVFLHAYAGTGGFWNATTRLLDGFRLLSLPETGINIDAVPGPRGPVTFRDLCLRQYIVMPAGQPAG
jgi:glutamate-5-semialdehyde dehydrogenase